jgi:hypothetical protein
MCVTRILIRIVLQITLARLFTQKKKRRKKRVYRFHEATKKFCLIFGFYLNPASIQVSQN